LLIRRAAEIRQLKDRVNATFEETSPAIHIARPPAPPAPCTRPAASTMKI